MSANLPSDDDFARAKAEAQLAQRLDPTLVEPCATMGALLFNTHQFAAAEDQFRQAFTLNPNYAVARYWHALLLWARGDLEDALLELERAERLDPLSFSMLEGYVRLLAYTGRYHEALAMNDRASAVRPNVPFVVAERALILLGLERKREAVEAARNVGRI